MAIGFCCSLQRDVTLGAQKKGLSFGLKVSTVVVVVLLFNRSTGHCGFIT